MNKNAIQKYAVWARNELIEQVKQRAFQYGISDKGYGEENASVINGRVLTTDEKRQRREFVNEIRQNGYQQSVEEVAYTWFNRFVALRFMEVNDYLPTHVRVFSDANGDFNPEILKDVLHLDLPGLDRGKVSELLNSNQTEELYRYLLLIQCNALNGALPEMFEKLGSYTEMLLPNNILKQDSVLAHLVKDIEEDDWKDAVQIIGWMYQYYNTEPKQAVFNGLKKNIKITKEKIPAATQLFTPDWIVRYMVENSLGRLWLESHPTATALKANWKYYLDEAEQTPEVAEKLRVLRSQSPVKSPENIRLIDPCMGSGHILVYAFDVLMQIYESEGYNPRDAAKLILEKNIYGLDIDRRAYQLAYFSLMMKARQYNRRIFDADVKPQVYHPAGFPDGEEYGSLVKVDKLPSMPARFLSDGETYNPHYADELRVWNFKQLLAQKYDVVVTNPPYMGSSGMGAKLSEFVKRNYPDSKSDLSTAFMEQTLYLCKPTGFMAMINIPVWMFLPTYTDLRNKLLVSNTIVNMLHFGRGVFGSDFGTTAFVYAKPYLKDYLSSYRKLYLKQGAVDNLEQKEKWFFENIGGYYASQLNFDVIPEKPIAYWATKPYLSAYKNGKLLKKVAPPKQGSTLGDNDRFLRMWYEVVKNKNKWFPCLKGGAFRKWYGNNEYLVNWENDGSEVKAEGRCTIRNARYLFQKGISWSRVTISQPSFRIMPKGFFFESASGVCFPNDSVAFILGLLNSKIVKNIAEMLNPTATFQSGDLGRVPVLATENQDNVVNLVDHNINLSRTDWDSFETSWDFKRHPLLKYGVSLYSGLGDVVNGEILSKSEIGVTKTDSSFLIYEKNVPKHFTIQSAYEMWKSDTQKRFDTLKANEEELNRIFIDIYGLQDELTPDVADKDVTVHRIYGSKEEIPESMVGSKYAMTKQDVIKSFISYAVGCMFGRYSLDTEGLAYAGGDWDAVKYRTFIPDKDNIIPICDDEYFDDDIVGRFVEFVRVVYGADTLEENLKFIADALGGRGTPREVIRNYFLNDFYKDHCKIYQKRPIYWLFDSGKKNGFKALVYMHRYSRDLLAKLRTDYVHEQQERYRTQLSHIASALNTATGAERARLLKQQDKLTEQLKEITAFEEKVHHLADQNIEIDLDDGVKKNYAIFADVLAKI